MSDGHEFYNGELSRQVQNLIRVGTIEHVDHAAHTLRVRVGDTLTEDLQWPAEIGRNFVRWRPLRVGQQVILASQHGDLQQAAVVGMLYTAELATPSNSPDLDLIQWNDGASVSYDIASKEMTIHSKGELYIKADKDIWLDAQNIHAFERE